MKRPKVYIRILQSEWDGAMYWLLRAYQSGHREGWEPGPSTHDTMDGILHWLANRGLDPNLDKAARAMLRRKRVPR